MTWQLLQTLSSDDLATAFRLQGRDVLEIARYLTGDRPVVLGGLTLVATATGVTVQPGALLQPFSGLVSAPRADESSTVLGRLGEASDVPVPALGVDTWYLVEARAAELDDYGTRLVQNQTTKVQTPQSVVVTRQSAMLLRARVGTVSAVPAEAAGWVPLGAVLRRTAGSVLPADVLDARPLADGVAEEAFTRHDYAISKLSAGARLALDVALVDRFGQHLSAQGDVAIASMLEQGFVVSSNAWQYLYLASTNLSAPPATANGRGVLVLSGTPPDAQGSRVPSAPLVLPAPWSGTTTRATCIGALWAYASDVYATQSCVRGRLSGAIGGTTQADALFPTPWDVFPRNARRVDFIAKWDLPASSDSRLVRVYTPSAGDPAFYADGEIRAADYLSQVIVPNLYVRGADYKDIRLDLGGASPMVSGTENLSMYGCDL